MTEHLHRQLAGTEACQTGAQAYHSVLQAILREGLRTGPRGMQTRELVDACVYIEDTTKAVPLGTGRLVNSRIGATEYCQLLAGVSFLEQLDEASGGRFSQFADDGALGGAYGPRAWSQLPQAAAMLEADSDTRQAVVMINKGTADAGSHDVPCTLGLQFKIRDGKLNCTVMMRSSDAWLGIPYDWWQFSRLQMTMAWALSIPPGSFTFFAGSLHLYERDLESAERVVSGALRTVDVTQPPHLEAGTQVKTAPERVRIAQAAARQIVMHESGCATHSWLSEKVPNVKGSWVICGTCRYVSKEGACKCQTA